MSWPRLAALALVAGLGIDPGQAAETASPVALADAARADLIARVSQSIIHVKGVRAAASRAAELFNPFTGASERERAKMLKRDPGLFSRIENAPLEPEREEGSAFMFDSVRGLAVTAAHIVSRSTTLTAILPDGRERPLELVGLDEETGLAVVKLKDATLPALSFASKRPRAGETALIVGKMIPFNAILASQGMVMGDANFGETGMGMMPPLADYFALDNLLPNGGLGGGPAVNMKGEVIGLVSAVFGLGGIGQGAVTVALRVGELKPTLDELIAKGAVRRSFIGVNTRMIGGALTIFSVTKGSPAEISGIKAGDRLISVNGQMVANEIVLHRLIATTPIGKDLSLQLTSEGVAKTVIVTTAERPARTKADDSGPARAFEAPGSPSV